MYYKQNYERWTLEGKMELISNSLISLDVDLDSKEALVEKLADLLEENSRLNDRERYIHDVFERENIISTCVGDMIVIPHAITEGVKAASLLYIRLKEPVEWNEGDQAKYILGIAVPADNINNQHLMILSSVAKKLLDDTIKNKLFTSTSKEEILAALLD